MKLPIVRDCPHTRKSNGIVYMAPKLISDLAGAVKDRDEWAVVLQGTHSDDWYEITVTGWRLPLQERNGGHVWILEEDKLQLDDVCVVHSHGSSYSATFSGTDKEKLNTRYPASIVIATGKQEFLGFAYSGVMKVILPCGSKGELEAKIQPIGAPELAKVVRVTHNDKDLGDCLKYHDASEDFFKTIWTSDCGLAEGPTSKVAAFGVTNNILEQVDKLAREFQYKQPSAASDKTSAKNPNKGKKNGNKFDSFREIVVGYICNKCTGPLLKSLARPGEGYCDQCRLYFTVPAGTPTAPEGGTQLKLDTEWCDKCCTDRPVSYPLSKAKCPECKTPFCLDCDFFHRGKCYRNTYRGLVGIL